jgi:hypothetical protein
MDSRFIYECRKTGGPNWPERLKEPLQTRELRRFAARPRPADRVRLGRSPGRVANTCKADCKPDNLAGAKFSLVSMSRWNRIRRYDKLSDLTSAGTPSPSYLRLPCLMRAANSRMRAPGADSTVSISGFSRSSPNLKTSTNLKNENKLAGQLTGQHEDQIRDSLYGAGCRSAP